MPRYGEATQAMLDEALAALEVSATGAVALGDPADRLAELSRRVDLLVVGSRAMGPIRQTLLGSTAARLVRGAHCALIVVPRRGATGAPGERSDAGTALAAT